MDDLLRDPRENKIPIKIKDSFSNPGIDDILNQQGSGETTNKLVLNDSTPPKKTDAHGSLFENFEPQREWWTNRVKELAVRFKDIYKMASLQVDLYSDRQVLLEYQHKILTAAAELNKEVKAIRKQKFLKYTNDYDLRLNSGERNIMVDGDLNKIKERQDLFDNQIEFCRESLKTYDSMIFGVKHRLSVEELTR